jgi:hypothetical protein
MLGAVNSNPTVLPPPCSNSADAKDLPSLANSLVKARTNAPSADTSFARPISPQSLCSYNRNLTSQTMHRPAPAMVITKPALRLSAQQMKDYRIFCTALGTNAGSQNIIDIMQGKHSALDVGKVMSELAKNHGEEAIRSVHRGKGREGVDLGTDMQTLVTREGLQKIAKDVYLSADASKLSTERVYRGLGMTERGIRKLLALKESETSVKSDYFLSCSKTMETAQSFADTYAKEGEVKVQFQIRGFSNMALRSYLPYGEQETLFTPHAAFKIERIFKGQNTGHFIVRLTEVPSDHKAVPLPY